MASPIYDNSGVKLSPLHLVAVAIGVGVLLAETADSLLGLVIQSHFAESALRCDQKPFAQNETRWIPGKMAKRRQN